MLGKLTSSSVIVQVGWDKGATKTPARLMGIIEIACLDTKTDCFASIIPNDGDDYTVYQHSKSTIADKNPLWLLDLISSRS